MRTSFLPIYYGWFVLAASAVCELLVMGATAYAAGLFVLPLQAEFHISRADANSAILLLYVGVVIVAPFVGKMLDAVPIRRVMVLGAAIIGLSFAGIAATSSLWVMAAILVLPAAIGFTSLGPLTTSTLVSRWFHRRRGLALGLGAVATSGGGFVVVPLLSEAIRQYGWRAALFYEGIIIAILIAVLALLVLRDRPSDMGLSGHPENQGRDDAIPAGQGNDDKKADLRWTDILASRAFWIPSLTLATISGSSQATIITLVPYGIQLGFTPAAAALLISVFAISAGVTKVVAGLLADYFNQRFLLIAAALFMTASWLALTLSTAYAGVFAGSSLAGIALGCALPTAGGLIAGHFGSARFGAVMGWTYALTAGLAILAVRFVGFMYDLAGNYVSAFQVFCVLLACLSLMTLLFARKPSADA